MNFLAHLLLSGSDPEVAFGNFIGDSIKGRKYRQFPENIQKGILLHRFIDTYTDAHPVIKSSKKLLNPVFRHYKGVIIDVLNDHFLSNHWNNYSDQNIHDFLNDFEHTFDDYKSCLTVKSRDYYSRFIALDFMAHYHQKAGIKNTLKGLEKRIAYRVPLADAMVDFETHYDEFEALFLKFFPDLSAQCQLKLQTDLKPIKQKQH